MPAPKRGLRDRALGRVLLLGLVLVAALLAARSCAAHEQEISQDEAVELATERASFTPCAQDGCVVVRAVQQGIPPELVWIVGLAESLDAGGKPTRVENYVVNARSGEVTRSR